MDPSSFEEQWSDVPPPVDPLDSQAAPTTWEPIDLGPYLRGEVQPPKPMVGVSRSDGIQFLYPGREHAILGGTEAGKTWVALMCVAAELDAGNVVVYIHFEESDPASTVERLRLLGVSDEVMAGRLRFVAPAYGVRPGWLDGLLRVRPSLVVLDGLNEATLMHQQKVDMDGWSLFRREVVVPFKNGGAAVLGCDHIPMGADETRRDAYGTLHKGAILDGARLMLINQEPFGRNRRGRSSLFVTKDRPGQLRSHGKPAKTPGVTFMGTLVVDDSQSNGPDFIASLYAPKPDDGPPVDSDDPVAMAMPVLYELVLGKPDRRIGSKNKLVAAAQNAGHKIRRSVVYDAANRLLDSGQFFEGKECGTAFIEAVPAPVPGPPHVADPCSPVPPVPPFKGNREQGTSRLDGESSSGNNREQPGTGGERDDQETTK